MDYKRQIQDFKFITGKEISEEDYKELILEHIALDKNSLNHRIASYISYSINTFDDMSNKLKDYLDEK